VRIITGKVKDVVKLKNRFRARDAIHQRLGYDWEIGAAVVENRNLDVALESIGRRDQSAVGCRR
jgi:hypothetical protein